MKKKSCVVKMDHTMVVDGILLHEQKDVTSSFDELTGQNQLIVSQKQEIEDLYCETVTVQNGREIVTQEKDSNMKTKEEIEVFQEDWKQAWKPSIFTSRFNKN